MRTTALIEVRYNRSAIGRKLTFFGIQQLFLSKGYFKYRNAASWALAHPEFGSSVHPIRTRGTDYTHHITACRPGFENLEAFLK